MQTEEPTPQRLRRALREGDVSISSVAIRTASLLAMLALLPRAATAVRSRFVENFRAAIGGAPPPTLEKVLLDVVTLAAPLLLVGAVLALSVGLLQTRGAAAGRSVPRPRPSAARSSRLFDARHAVKSILGALALAAVLAVTLRALMRAAPEFAATMPSAARAMELSGKLLPALGWTVGSVLTLASMVDYLVEQAFWRSRLRMSREEVAQERREQEGDPDVRRARRRLLEALMREPRRP